MHKTIAHMLMLAVTFGTQVHTANAEMVGGSPISYFVSAPPVSGYLAKPSGEGPHPALILIHEWWGLNDDIRAKARDFAAQGYVALAVDLYGGLNTTDPLTASQLASTVRDNMDSAFENLQSAVAFLKADKTVDAQRLASIGWCFGGGWSFQMAKNDLGISASVIYYGQFNPDDDLNKMRAEIIGHFAENDTVIEVDDVRAFQARLSTLSSEHEIYIYPNTTHGFASRRDANPMYVKEAADTAWARTLAFLEMHL